MRIIKFEQTSTGSHPHTGMELQGNQKLEHVVESFERFLLCCGYDMKNISLGIIRKAEEES